MDPTLICNDEQRRRAVRQTALNGLDYVELQEERKLRVFFLGKAPDGLRKEHFCVRGGRSVTGLRVVAIDLKRNDAKDEDDTAAAQAPLKSRLSKARLRRPTPRPRSRNKH